MNDSQEQPTRKDPHYDPLYKVRPVLDCANTLFWNNTFQAGDEAMVKYKGRMIFRQYMPKKPVTMGMVKRLADVHVHSCT